MSGTARVRAATHVREALAAGLGTTAVVPTDLDETYERLLGPDRRATGTYYTPAWLVEHVLDSTLEPALDDLQDAGLPAADIRVCDPACGSGRFLVAAARRIAARGVPLDVVVDRCLVGLDLDPVALELAAASLRALARSDASPDLRCVDALATDVLDDLVGRCHVVVGNPPFGTRLRGAAHAVTHAPGEVDGVRLGPCTDLSAAFLVRSLSLLTDHGRTGLVQPRSLLAARDAEPVRAAVAAAGALTDLWLATGPVFPGTPVLTCAPTVHRRAAQGAVRVTRGRNPVACRRTPESVAGTWGHLEDPETPRLRLTTTHAVGDVARCTADFREQYYALVGHVREATVSEAAEPSAPTGVLRLVTSGAIDPAALRWGTRPARFGKQQWDRPVVELDDLPPGVAEWARSRAVPKVVLATQGAVLEAAADPTGAWLPSVPVVSVVAPASRQWHLLAALVSPPLTAVAVREHAGAGLSVTSLRLSARQVAALPLPGSLEDPGRDWDEAADHVRAAQVSTTGAERAGLLLRAAHSMLAAYAVPLGDRDDLLAWWAARAERSVPGLLGALSP